MTGLIRSWIDWKSPNAAPWRERLIADSSVWVVFVILALLVGH
ncbi:MAG TPA: hypothetical protein VNE58_13825 [Casimicrobiaceae bacterium]|nr:hypothetical protein [Casimicrobiaceae bacterium]